MNNLKKFSDFSEGNKWIDSAIKKPGSLRKTLKKKTGDKISNTEINDEISKLKKKDKDMNKEGIQGLSKSDLTKYKRLNLAKTLKGLKESHEHTDNYMFWGNLESIKRMVDEMLEMDRDKVNDLLEDGHEWAIDHICTSKDDVDEVSEFLVNIIK